MNNIYHVDSSIMSTKSNFNCCKMDGQPLKSRFIFDENNTKWFFIENGTGF